MAKYLPGQTLAWNDYGLRHVGSVVAVLESGAAVVQPEHANAAVLLPVDREVEFVNPKTLKLANGHAIIHYDAEKHLVIADLGDRYERFVVWNAEPSVVEGSEHELFTHAGHYFKTILDAVEDFYTR